MYNSTVRVVSYRQANSAIAYVPSYVNPADSDVRARLNKATAHLKARSTFGLTPTFQVLAGNGKPEDRTSESAGGRQVTHKHAHTLDPTKSEWADYATVQA